MINIENVRIDGWESAVRGMRNPLNSWHLSDSQWGVQCLDGDADRDSYVEVDCDGEFYDYLGSRDVDLMIRLRNAGTDHRKFMRMIVVWCDVTAPLYWWKEADTYKVGTVSNSCSTMHKIAAKPFTVEDFSHEHLDSDRPNLFICRHSTTDDDELENVAISASDWLYLTVAMLNYYRDTYVRTKDKHYWWQLVQMLPDSYNQRRTLCLNYEVLANMYKSRKDHKLDEWRELCEWMTGLPMSCLITGDDVQ